MRYSAIAVWVCALVLVAGVAEAAKPKKGRPDTSNLEKWSPSDSDMAMITRAVRERLAREKIDEVKWIGPYRWRDRIRVIWLQYKYVSRDSRGEPVVAETIVPFLLQRGILTYARKDGSKVYWTAEKFGIRQNGDFATWVKRTIATVERKEKADALLAGKKVTPGRNPPPPKKPAPVTKLRTWTDASGKFTITAELLDYRKGMVTLLTDDERAIRLELSKLSKADQRYVAAKKD